MTALRVNWGRWNEKLLASIRKVLYICKNLNRIIMNEEIINQARYICVSIPYDKDDEPRLISFDDGLMTELECDDDFTPPTLNPDTQLLE